MLSLIRFFLIFGLIFSGLASHAKVSDLHEFKRIIILDQGRVKPLDTFASSILLRLSGKANYNNHSAIEWLAALIFNSKESYKDQVFLINNPELLEAIEVKANSSRRYSFNELKLGINKLYELAGTAAQIAPKDQTQLDKEFIRVFQNFNLFIQLVNSLNFCTNHPDFYMSNPAMVEKLKLESQNNNFITILSRVSQLESMLRKIPNFKSTNLNDDDKEVVKLVYNLYEWTENYKMYSELRPGEQSLKIISTDYNSQWYSPWDAILEPRINAPYKIFLLEKAYKSYNSANQKSFDLAIRDFNKLAIQSQTKIPKINSELLYNRINPFTNAKILYAIAFLLTILTLVVLPKINEKIALALTIFGFTFHSIGIALRVFILERAPVTNLYETFIFVSWIIVVLGFIICALDQRIKESKSLGLILGTFAGLVLLLISSKFAAEGDTMQVLIAVLNSNFWLSTHVICISIGYAGVAAAGLMGHIYLIQKIGKQNDITINKTHSLILGLLGFGLCFSFLGTMLGGVWADQSWGRFWGWDPKENGALLIVLWTVMLFHARLSGLIKKDGLAIGSVIGTAVVMTSWFGINLLGVGLHSYGFTEGLAFKLYLYYAFEFVFIVLSLLMMPRKIRHTLYV